MKFVLYGFLLWRAVILLAAMTVLAVFSYNVSFSYINALPPPNPLDYLYGLANFDGIHYLRTVNEGYKAEFSQAFFPLYPILIKTVGVFTFNNFLISGLIISNLSFLLGLIFFYKLAKEDFGENVARWGTVFLLTFPTSFFFGAVYNEGLFFLLVVLGFYAGRKNRWLLAGIAGGLASATRFFGILLLPALAVSFWEVNIKGKISRPKISHLSRLNRDFSFLISHFSSLIFISYPHRSPRLYDLAQNKLQ
ncbi:MAG: glycosyltransferase family 39 protein [bacterium]|nr:glycosyltransferase family 39 protein [bacterium]